MKTKTKVKKNPRPPKRERDDRIEVRTVRNRHDASLAASDGQTTTCVTGA